jgi:hypothetical protein
MGVSPDCIAAVRQASGGTFTDQDAADLIRQMEKLRQTEEAAGRIDGLTARVEQLAREEADRTRIAAAQARRHAALAAIAYKRTLDQVTELVAQGRRYDQALLAVFEGDGQRGLVRGRDSVHATKAAYLQRWTAQWSGMLAGNDRVRILTERADEAFHLAVLREMEELKDGGKPGISGDADARALARIYADAAEAARIDRNRYGGSIGKLEGWRPQSHDSLLVAKAGREQWMRDIRAELDLAKTYPNMNEAQITRLLSETYDHIVLGTRAATSQPDPLARVGPANLANRLGAARELHFKDAAAWDRYRKQYGGGGIHGAMLDHLSRAARDAALLERLGPNPEAMLGRLRQELASRAMADERLKPEARDRARRTLLAPGGPVQDAYAEASGLTSQPVNTRWADIMAGIRNQQRAAKLAGAALSQIVDPAVRAAKLTSRGAPVLETYLRSIGMWWADLLHTRQVPRELREALASLAIGADGMRNAAWADLMAEDRRPGVLAKITDLVMKVQGMTFLARKLREGTAYMQAEYLGRQSAKRWDQLDPLYARGLATYGITPELWEAVRPLARTIDGKRWLTPDMVRWLPDDALLQLAAPRLAQLDQQLAARRGKVDRQAAIARVLEDTQRDAEMAFRRFFAEEMLGSTLEPDAQMRRFMVRGTQPGTGTGEALRLIGLFKSFPIAYAQRVLASAVLGFRPGERGQQAAHIAGLLALSTLLGYAAMTAKDLVRGYSPRDPSNYKTWLAALAQGGGIGIYGDFIFGQGSRFGNTALETVAGPALSGAANIIGIWQRAKDGDAKAGDALGVLLRETPFINLWWARPVLDAAFLNSLREWASPGTLQRQARQREQDYGQERWAPQGLW